VTARTDVRLSAYEGESGIVGSGSDEAAVRIDALDGIRALAIILVMIHNVGSVAGPSSGTALKLWGLLSNAGWIGVQLFFALSGFLITRILLRSAGTPGWMKSFYARRALRIVPLTSRCLRSCFSSRRTWPRWRRSE
jgi:peptidoglycan/LPS O-acetylase OafA/YrhL